MENSYAKNHILTTIDMYTGIIKIWIKNITLNSSINLTRLHQRLTKSMETDCRNKTTYLAMSDVNDNTEQEQKLNENGNEFAAIEHEEEATEELIFGVDDVPPFHISLFYAFQVSYFLYTFKILQSMHHIS